MRLPLLAALLIAALPAQLVVVPFDPAKATPEDRARLEAIVGVPLEKALAAGLVESGDVIDPKHPVVAFVIEWNKWIKLRQGTKPQAVDAKEAKQWREVEKSFKRLAGLIKAGVR